METRELIGAYERILAITGWMVEAARRGDWERLVDLERLCRAEVDCVIALGPCAPRLPLELQARKAQIIRGVLADDAEIRRLTEPCMAQLERLIGKTRNERRLAHSYGARL